MAYDNERIAKILADLEKFLKDLELLNIKSKKDLDDLKNFYSASMVLFSIINRLIDLGDEIVSGAELGMPGTYKEIFIILCNKGLIENKLAKELSGLVSYRNKISHEYYDVTPDEVFRLLQNIKIAKEFLEKAKKIIRK